MSYNDFLGILSVPENINGRQGVTLQPVLSSDLSSQYDTVRFGIPNGTISFEDTKAERDILVRHYFSHGYETWPHNRINIKLKKHVALFRASLDLWEEFSPSRCYSKDELYVRCLREGPSFTEFIKKARATSLRALTTETRTNIEEEYFIPSYTGYNSILHERYLIHWDDTKDVDDIKYAFLPRTKERTKHFEHLVRKMFKDFRLDEIDFPDELDMIGILKNTKMYDPKSKKTALMREFWDKDVDPTSPYFAKRVVVPTEPGHTRDTGVGDPGSILKVKQLNALARAISEKLPYSANAPSYVANARYKRVLKRNAFLHLDFKKFGLTWPRDLTNALLTVIEEVSGINLEHLRFDHFYVEIDGETYETERGTMLGWTDTLNSICVSAILHNLSTEEGLGFDFVTFNDDVEISKRCQSDLSGTMELLRMAVIAELDSYDIPISIDKTYASRGSIFLERYAYFERNYKLDMYKEQLTVASYAKSLVSEYPWQAKLFYASAELWTKNQYATDRCIDTCPIEFRKEEITLPLWSGGWRIPIDPEGLDLSLEESDRLGYLLGLRLSEFKPKKYSTRREKVSSNSEIWRTVNERAFHANSKELGRALIGITEDINEINIDVSYIQKALTTLADTYQGRNESFPLSVVRVAEKAFRIYNWDNG